MISTISHCFYHISQTVLNVQKFKYQITHVVTPECLQEAATESTRTSMNKLDSLSLIAFRNAVRWL
jgi:hypothetical protein